MPEAGSRNAEASKSSIFWLLKKLKASSLKQQQFSFQR